jgi:hypothetical protein
MLITQEKQKLVWKLKTVKVRGFMPSSIWQYQKLVLEFEDCQHVQPKTGQKA